jgi:hexosaminidase
MREPGAIWGGAFDVRKVYSFDFVKEGFTPEEVAQVKGFEAAAWSEAFLSQGGDTSIDFVEYQTFPRLCALAELGWGKNGGGEWSEFQKRLYTRHYDRMADMGINFRITPSDVKYENGVLSVVKIDDCVIYHREDGSTKVRKYGEPIKTSSPAKFVFWSEYRGHKSPEFAHASRYNTIQPAFTLTSSMPVNPKYGFDKVMTYKSEARTTRACRKGDWFLYEFEKPLECRAVEFYAGYFAMPSRCFPSGYIEISEDGKRFKRVAELVGGKVLLENPGPIKAARLVSTGDLIGASSVRFIAPKIYPKL